MCTAKFKAKILEKATSPTSGWYTHKTKKSKPRIENVLHHKELFILTDTGINLFPMYITVN